MRQNTHSPYEMPATVPALQEYDPRLDYAMTIEDEDDLIMSITHINPHRPDVEPVRIDN